MYLDLLKMVRRHAASDMRIAWQSANKYDMPIHSASEDIELKLEQL